jgi:hypothetical protein
MIQFLIGETFLLIPFKTIHSHIKNRPADRYTEFHYPENELKQGFGQTAAACLAGKRCLVLRADSLMPVMLINYLVNMFIGSFTMYFQRYAPAETQILYAVINLTFAVPILILWVKFFCAGWIPIPVGLKPISLRRKQN